MTHPRAQLHGSLTSPVRLSLLAALLDLEEVEFQTMQERLQVPAAVLSKHMSALEALGFVVVRKGYVGKRPRTWLAVTPEGKQGYAGHRAALLAIIRGS